MKIYLTDVLAILVIILLAYLVVINFSGCATFEIQTPDLKIKSTTIGKDIVIDPNGVMSTVSPKNQGILEVLFGGIAGFFIAGV